jgi:hypothetical protein
MKTLYRDSVEIYDAAVHGAKEAFDLGRSSPENRPSPIRHPSWLLATGIGLGTVATCIYRRRSSLFVPRRIVQATSLVMAGLALWSSRKLISSTVVPATRAVSRTRDRHWLRDHPITYA